MIPRILYWKAIGTAIAIVAVTRKANSGTPCLVFLERNLGSCPSSAIASKILGVPNAAAILIPNIDITAP